MEELTSIVELSESVFDMVLDMVGSYFPLATLPFAVYLAFCLVKIVLSADGNYMAGSDPVYREKLTEADIKTINQELRTLEAMGQARPEPGSTHRGEATAPESAHRREATAPESTHRDEAATQLRTLRIEPEKHVKMVTCRHCLAPKPKHGTCAYCGLG